MPRYAQVRFESLIFLRSRLWVRDFLGLFPVRVYCDQIVFEINAWSAVYPTRRAQCYLQIMKPQLAVADFKSIIAIEPNNLTVKQQLEGTQRLVRKIEFEKAR